MSKKTSPTILEQAINQVLEFESVVKKLAQQVILRGQSKSPLDKYSRRGTVYSQGGYYKTPDT